jgi:transposase
VPAYLTLPAHLPLAELERRDRAARDPVARSHWQIIWLLSSGHRATSVATVTGYSVNWVREIARRYRQDGAAGLGDRRHHNPGGPALLDAAGRAALQAALTGPAPDGGLWTGRQVAHWLSRYLHRPVSPQRGWEYLTQAGFTPQRPRPSTVQADPVAQTMFKKGGSRRPSTR